MSTDPEFLGDLLYPAAEYAIEQIVATGPITVRRRSDDTGHQPKRSAANAIWHLVYAVAITAACMVRLMLFGSPRKERRHR